MAGCKATLTPGWRCWTSARYTHLSVIPISLDQDPFKTRLDVVDVVVVLQRAEHTRSVGKVRAQWLSLQLTAGQGWGHPGPCVI